MTIYIFYGQYSRLSMFYCRHCLAMHWNAYGEELGGPLPRDDDGMVHDRGLALLSIRRLAFNILYKL